MNGDMMARRHRIPIPQEGSKFPTKFLRPPPWEGSNHDIVIPHPVLGQVPSGHLPPWTSTPGNIHPLQMPIMVESHIVKGVVVPRGRSPRG